MAIFTNPKARPRQKTPEQIKRQGKRRPPTPEEQRINFGRTARGRVQRLGRALTIIYEQQGTDLLKRIARTAFEADLQRELRRLHQAVEDKRRSNATGNR